MKKRDVLSIAILIAAMAFPAISNAQEQISTTSKIDSIYSLQKKMYVESKTGPLADKKYGIEVNLFRLLMIDEVRSFSGSFSLFNVDRKAEIAFPIYYQNPKSETDLTEFTADCHYRYFLGKTQNGFYLSAFARFAHLNGTLGDNNYILYDGFGNPITTNLKKDTENKIGIGFGLGYRIFSYRGLYWGTSMSIGRYIIGKNDRFMGSFLTLDDDSPLIYDVELLKFGWAF
ncbi:MAG: hypothetical protein PHV20_00175 [Bacteroidales bacterium]|nr:hypothetical protein [Bacteroidales bacterium]